MRRRRTPLERGEGPRGGGGLGLERGEGPRGGRGLGGEVVALAEHVLREGLEPGDAGLGLHEGGLGRAAEAALLLELRGQVQQPLLRLGIGVWLGLLGLR